VKVQLNKYNNDWFNPGSKIKIFLWMIISTILFRIHLPLLPSSIKAKILKLFGAKIGDGVVIKPSVNIKYPWNLKIGNYSWLGENVWIDNLGYVTIGNNCCLSQGCFILTGNHDFKSSNFDLIVLDVVLEDESWVGAKSVICPGVKMGHGSILTVGSVASKNLSDFGVYKGNPAIKIKERYTS
jgi:putative colanic acid biosynthesis acetyltransferase WcaF